MDFPRERGKKNNREKNSGISGSGWNERLVDKSRGERETLPRSNSFSRASNVLASLQLGVTVACSTLRYPMSAASCQQGGL
ncbi:hypothetical protein MHYP_G00232140 [Metynnis hypsauchen]